MKLMFLGDSITDCNRNREKDTSLGEGYALMVAGELAHLNPNKYTFYNKGVSGDRIVDVYARIKRDVWNYEPDIISFLIGVNDVWHELNEVPNGVGARRFETMYEMLICDTLQRLPNCKFMLIAPFVLEGTATNLRGLQVFKQQVKIRAEIVKKLAQKYNFPLLEVQVPLDKMCEKANPEYWLIDGVHPTHAGHAFIANEWKKAFNDYL